MVFFMCAEKKTESENTQTVSIGFECGAFSIMILNHIENHYKLCEYRSKRQYIYDYMSSTSGSETLYGLKLE